MKNLLSIRSLAAAALIFTGLTTASVHAQSAAAVTRAQSLVSSERATIATLCHPTATLNSVSRVEIEETSSGFTAEYKFSFTSAFGNDFNTRISFAFDDSGRFTRELTVTGTSTLNPLGQPFEAAGIVVDVLKEELQKTETVRKNAVLARLVRHADAESLCELLLWTAQ